MMLIKYTKSIKDFLTYLIQEKKKPLMEGNIDSVKIMYLGFLHIINNFIIFFKKKKKTKTNKM